LAHNSKRRLYNFHALLVAVQQYKVIYIVVVNNLKAEIYNKGVLLKVRLTSVNKESITNVNYLNSLVKQVDDLFRAEHHTRRRENLKSHKLMTS
jgi:predicted fused transcriptional regulator/phosphomethylpyrimidine kinase